MRGVAEFTANSWGWIFLIGLLLAVAFVAGLYVWMAHKEWKSARRAEKMNSHEVKRLSDIAERVRRM